MKTERVPIDSVQFDAANVRRHGEKNLATIKASLSRFGQQKPIVVDAAGVVRAGNGTLAAAKALGWKEITVVRSTLAGAEATAYAIADNRTAELAEWDDDALAQTLAALQIEDEDLAIATGFDAKEIDALLAPDEVTEDEVPEPPSDPITKPGDLWLLGDHRLLCGDSTKAEDVAKLMNGEKVDCVFTSPPYAVGVDYGDTYDDTIENLRAMLPILADFWSKMIVDGGFAVVNFGDIVSGRKITGTEEPCEYPMALEYWPIFRAADFNLWSRRIWCKPITRTAAPWCAQSNRAATNFEHIWTWKKSGEAIVGRVSHPMESNAGYLDTGTTAVEVGKDTHGAGMHSITAAWMLNVHSRKRSVVHEPFCGTGTTLIAAEQLGRNCYGMEISPAYCDVIVKRWETMTGKKAVRG